MSKVNIFQFLPRFQHYRLSHPLFNNLKPTSMRHFAVIEKQMASPVNCANAHVKTF